MEKDRIYNCLLGLNKDNDEVRGMILGIRPLAKDREVFLELRREERSCWENIFQSHSLKFRKWCIEKTGKNIYFRKTLKRGIELYTSSDLVGCTLDRKSTSGYFLFVRERVGEARNSLWWLEVA